MFYLLLSVAYALHDVFYIIFLIFSFQPFFFFQRSSPFNVLLSSLYQSCSLPIASFLFKHVSSRFTFSLFSNYLFMSFFLILFFISSSPWLHFVQMDILFL